MSRGWVIGAATLSAFRRRGCSFRRVLAVSTGDQDLRFTRDVEKRQVWEFLDGGRARGLKVEAGDTFRGRPNPTPEQVSRYEEWHRAHISIKPGPTGRSQTAGRDRISDFEKVCELDLAYIENGSLLLDLKLVAKTLAVVVLGVGAR